MGQLRVNKITLIVVFCCLRFFPALLYGQSDIYSFRQISYEQGLPGVNVRDIFQDSREVIWIAVEDMGVCKYYGNKLVNYLSDPQDSTGLSSNFTNSIAEDAQGNIWIATDYGLNKYDRKSNRFTRYYSEKQDKNSISDNKVNKLFLDSKGVLWVGTHRGLDRYNPKADNFDRLSSLSGPVFSDGFIVNDIHEDQNGALWLASHSGLIKLDLAANTSKLFTRSSPGGNDLAHNQINAVTSDKAGVLWVGSHRGVNKFDPKSGQFFSYGYKGANAQHLKDEGISTIYNDHSGYLWIGTYTKGIIKIDIANDSYSRITKTETVKSGLTSDHIRSILKDKNGLLWIGTKFEGVFIHDLNKTVFSKWPLQYELFLPLKEKHILKAYKDWKFDDVYWVATKFDGLYRVNAAQNTIKNYRYSGRKPTSINSDRIQAVLRDRQGNMYIGSEEGFDLLYERAEEFTHISKLPVSVIFQDSRGVLWTASYQGIRHYDEKNSELKRWPSKHPFFKSNIDVKCLFESADARLWITTENSGLYWYDPANDSLAHFSHQPGTLQGLSSNMTRPVTEDSDGNMWIGTKDAGLVRYDRKTGGFRNYTVVDGLATNFILSLEEDSSGYLWIGTYNGLVKFDRHAETFTNFNREYGLRNNIFELAASCNMGDGHLLFGGHNGFNIFHADSIIQKQSVSSLIISSVKVLGQEILRDIHQYHEITLPHHDNYISIEFLLADYSNTFRHQFAYKMEGLDNSWNYAGNRNYVSYSSLAPGEYTLKIRGANEFGIWNDEGIQLKITLLPPFYKTRLFRSIAALVLLIGAWSVYTSRTIKNKKAKKILEEKIKERTLELQNALIELREQQTKIELQNEELSSQYKKILSQRDEIQDINFQLSNAHNELKEANRTLDERVKERTEKLIKTNQELDRFVYSASHDLSAPLKSILGLINIAKYENKDKSLANNLEYMERSVRKLEDVIKSLTQFSRNMGHKLKKVNLAFDDIVDDVVNEAKMAYNCNDALIIKEYNNGALIYTDYMRLRIILTNLIGNAFKYRKENGKLEVVISFMKIEDNYVIKIRDNGIGIAKDDQENVFGMFFRATGQSEGSGLGLYIVSETLAKLQGGITLDSEPDQFTEFTVEIPVINSI